MKLGEVALLTNDVISLATFYKFLLGIEDAEQNEVHQTILTEETMLTICHEGTVKNNANQNICLAFTVEDVDQEYIRLIDAGIQILEPPTTRPWGARNMSFQDPDGNRIYFRSFIE